MPGNRSELNGKDASDCKRNERSQKGAKILDNPAR